MEAGSDCGTPYAPEDGFVAFQRQPPSWSQRFSRQAHWEALAQAASFWFISCRPAALTSVLLPRSTVSAEVVQV